MPLSQENEYNEKAKKLINQCYFKLKIKFLSNVCKNLSIKYSRGFEIDLNYKLLFSTLKTIFKKL